MPQFLANMFYSSIQFEWVNKRRLGTFAQVLSGQTQYILFILEYKKTSNNKLGIPRVSIQTPMAQYRAAFIAF